MKKIPLYLFAALVLILLSSCSSGMTYKCTKSSCYWSAAEQKQNSSTNDKTFIKRDQQNMD